VSAARVRVPATSANLGPAFDCAGLALSRHDVLEFAVQPSGLTVEVSGVGAGELPADESHLVVRAFRAASAELGWSPPGLRVVAENAIPQGRGMGSSAAAVVAGVCWVPGPCAPTSRASTWTPSCGWSPRWRGTRTTWRRACSAVRR
jgi:homoserine kinase